MDRKPPETGRRNDDREARLKAALKDNLRRRKAQAKARGGQGPDKGATEGERKG